MTTQPISQEQFQRLENEWRQMREGASSPKPQVSAAAK